MILLGVTGAIGSGKTSFADAVQSIETTARHFEAGLIVTEVVDQLNQRLELPMDPRDLIELNRWLSNLPRLIGEVTHTAVDDRMFRVTKQAMLEKPGDYAKLMQYLDELAQNPYLSKQFVTPTNKEAYRPILQWVGGFCVKHVKQTIWFDEIISRAQQASAEGSKICVAGGVRFPAEAEVIHKAKGYVIEIQRPDSNIREATDITEIERAEIPSDCVVFNDGTLADLRTKTRAVLHDVGNGDLREAY